MEQIKNQKLLNQGFIALTSVILISAVIGVIIVSISVQTIDESQISLAFEKSRQSKYNALSCADNILLELSNDPNFTPASSLTIDLGGSDSIYCATTTLSDEPGGNQILRIESGDEFVSKLEIDIASTTPEINISSFNFVD